MLWIFLAALACSAVATLAVIVSADRHSHWSADHDLSGPQKMHVKVVPRVGGLGIFAGILGGAAMTAWTLRGCLNPVLLLCICMLPALLAGIWEDFTKAISPRRRMVAMAFSGLLGVLLLGGSIVRTGVQPFDDLLAGAGLMWLGSVGAIFAITGIANSVNIIDGMNGLASMCVSLMACALAYVAWRVGDGFIGAVALSTLGATLGFFMWNYPRGLVFLGDGGAYLLGFILAETGILLTLRHPQVSMLMPLLLVGYPVFETLFTMYRRRIVQRRPMTQPDGIHLHTLIYRRLRRGALGVGGERNATRANSQTSPYLWLLNLLAVIPAAIWWDSTPQLALAMLSFILIYLWVYWRIVTFRSPKWMARPVNREAGQPVIRVPKS
jgi:UDP-N-acetylmuramyl pentapeptide phosphotransferase/UDP-N-acetylglucosamine-1-phosphate transferase